ncbi:MAG: DUF1501 domain-containing protein [Planctomycetes bacterium]|nr:DUF1501 domain-containing protein [Planctomycetota bacterium]
MPSHVSVRCPGPSRRDFLRAGFLSLGGLSLGDLLRLRAQGSATNRDTAVLLLFLHGGPSHFETYDPKPEAPAEVRGPFTSIRTRVPGIDICEHLPRHAQVANRFSLIRSCHHDEADHFAGHRRFLSGYGRLKPGFGYESYYPQVGAVVNRVHANRRPGIPAALSVGGVCVNGPDYAAGISEGYWSGTYRVPIINGGLRDGSLLVDGRRLDDRLSLMRGFDRMRRELDVNGSMDVMDHYNRRALEMLTTNHVQRAFDLSQEDPRMRERYGDGYGREVLLARRLVEAGVSFVTARIPGSGPGSMAHDWDDHAVNWDMLTAMNARLPRYDHIISTLINDIYDRGLDEKVLVIATGEFGRTPRLENNNGKIGRDHYPSAMSILVSGGGMRMGQVIGSTDSMGARPRTRPLDPHDILATIYRHLGIDHHAQFPDLSGRPIALTNGEPVAELF